jgi:glycosidase
MLAEASENYLHQVFDMTYNWKLKDLMNEIVQGKKKATDIVKYYEVEKKEYATDDYRMVFTSNHDENTWHGSEYERLGNGVEAFTVLCGTFPGMPLIYSGQEAGLKKRLRFFDKDTIAWKPDRLREKYTKLNLLKKMNKALWNGAAGGEMIFINTDINDVLAFVRAKGNNKVLAVFNLSGKASSINLKNNLVDGNYFNLFDDKVKLTFSGEINLQLEPWGFRVYSK